MSAPPGSLLPPVRPSAVRRRTAVAGLVAALVAALLLVAPAQRAHAAPVLLSQGRPATASSQENAGTPASAAVDGDGGTRWSSAWSDPQWLQVDLGATASVSRVELSWEAAYATGYRIEFSGDGTHWSTAYSTSAGAGGTETVNLSGSARYVRMYGTARATQYGYSLWEFQVYGTHRRRQRVPRAGRRRPGPERARLRPVDVRVGHPVGPGLRLRPAGDRAVRRRPLRAAVQARHLQRAERPARLLHPGRRPRPQPRRHHRQRRHHRRRRLVRRQRHPELLAFGREPRGPARERRPTGGPSRRRHPSAACTCWAG